MAAVLYIGRFQPFHNGHLKVVEQILNEKNSIVIGIGSSNEKNTKENPFSAGERATMIMRALKDSGIQKTQYKIIKIPDLNNDDLWIKKVNELANNYDIAYANNKAALWLYQFYGIKTKSTAYFPPFKGLYIRRRIAKNKPWENYVPKAVYDYIIEIKGDQRIRKLSKKNKKNR